MGDLHDHGVRRIEPVWRRVTAAADQPFMTIQNCYVTYSNIARRLVAEAGRLGGTVPLAMAPPGAERRMRMNEHSPQPGRIGVFLVDDHEIFRRAYGP